MPLGNRVPTCRARAHGAGMVVLDSKVRPVYANRVALQVLTFPKRPEEVEGLADYIASRIRSAGLDLGPTDKALPPKTFVSGNRRYVCRFFALGAPLDGSDAAPVGVLLLERSPRAAADVAGIAAEFNLTERERETVTCLVEGLTSKEIAQRMGISPNTVKVFLRLAMLKMGVSTRSGIIGALVKRSEGPSAASERARLASPI